MRGSWFRRSVLVIATLAVVGSALPSIAGATPTRATARSGFNLSSKPFRSGGWRWSLDAAIGLDGVLTFSMRARRTLGSASHPIQTHDWRIDLPASDLKVDHADLMPARLDTGTDLGRFGAIDVSLQDGTTLESKSDTCAATGDVLDRIHWRTGTFSGSFDLKPGKGLPTDVAATSFEATISKIYDTANACPVGGGGGCPVGSSIAAFQAGDDRMGTLFAADEPTNASIGFDDVSYTADRSILKTHSMIAVVPPGAVVVRGDSAVVHSKPFGVWASGSVRLTLGQAHVVKVSPTCTRTHYDITAQTGGITVHFATGDYGLSTPFPHGISVTVVSRI
jgi:hypothetical protein